MNKTNIVHEQDVLGFERPDEGLPLAVDPEIAGQAVRVTVILAIAALALAAVLYFTQH